MNTLTRPQEDKIIGGVCSGLARRFNVSTTLVRIIFFLLLILPPAAIVPYIVLWILIPTEQSSSNNIIDVETQ